LINFHAIGKGVIIADEMQIDMLGGIPNSRVVAVYDSPEISLTFTLEIVTILAYLHFLCRGPIVSAGFELG